MATRRVTPEPAGDRLVTANPLRYLARLGAWLSLHGLSSAGRAMYCLPPTDPIVSRPRWWRAEARSGIDAIDAYLADPARQPTRDPGFREPRTREPRRREPRTHDGSAG